MKRTIKYSLIIVIFIMLFYPVGYFVLDDDPNFSSKVIEFRTDNFEGIGAYLINLESSRDRLNYVTPKILDLGIPLERIEAVEGKKMEKEERQQVVDFDSYNRFLGHGPKLGTIGCSLSHIKAWRKFLESNFEFAVIFEDDIDFEPQKLSDTIQYLVQNKQYWDINNFETQHNGLPLTVNTLENDTKIVVYLAEVTHAGAYIISRKAAKKLLKKALPIKMPIDHYFTRGWELGLIFTGIEPRLVKQNYGDSDINSTDFAPGQEKHFSLSKPLFKIQSYIARFLYNLKQFIKLKK